MGGIKINVNGCISNSKIILIIIIICELLIQPFISIIIMLGGNDVGINNYDCSPFNIQVSHNHPYTGLDLM